MAAEYRVLGPLEVLLDGVAVAVPAGRCRVLLATLLLRPNEVVPVDELVERVWDGAPPSSGRADKTLQMVVARLRQALGAANCVQTSRGGYLASVEVSQLDLLRFRALVASGDFAAATALWRGPMLSDVRSDALHQHDVPPVAEERLLALEHRIAADLDAGRAADLVAELRGLTAEHPFREAFWSRLVLALAQSGQQAAALTAYQDARALLADELGVAPGPELRAAHQQVLSGSVRVRGPVPRQLPTAVPRFVGRAAELDGLTGLLRDELVVAAITGTAGVGKTTLAVHWARGAADRFPDGQLYVNLRGFDRHQDPMAPGDALSGFLVALGVAPERVPTDLDAASAMFRGAVAGKQVLVVLDNARDSDQVRPLLPGPSAGLVLITSRDHLTGLVEGEGVRRLALDVLSHAEATALLVSRLGEERVGVADDLIRWCGGLPLALAIVAARAAQSPALPLSALVAELADERTRLDTLDTGDVATSVRAVFQWSYQQLGAAAARMFRLVGVHPGPDVTVAAAASLAGWPVGEARKCLRELVRANLLLEHQPGRFACHDLLRVYAADRAAAQEPAESLAATEERVLDHYLHTLIDINTTHYASSRPLREEPARAAGTSPEVFETLADANAWFRAEEDVLRSVIARSAAKGFDRHTWQLVWTAFDLIDRFGPWRNWSWVLESAREAAARTGDRENSEKTAFLEAVVSGRLGLYEESRDRFEACAHALADLGDVPGQVRCLGGVVWSLVMLGQQRESLEVAEAAYELQRGDPSATGERVGEALHRVVQALLFLGRNQEALDRCAELESLTSETTPPYELGRRAATKGVVFLKIGEFDRAVETLTASVGWLEQAGTWSDVASAQKWLGEALQRAGDVAGARRRWIEALETFEHHRHPFADQVRAQLAALPEN